MRLLLAVLLVAGCSQSSGPTPRRAAEPGVAPPVSKALVGRVIQVGGEAEGVVVDSDLHLAAVGVRKPFGLAIVDLRTNRVVRTVPLPGHVRHLALSGHRVLAPLEDVGLVDEVDLRTGGIVSQLPAPGYPHGVSALGTGDVLVGQERGGKVSLFTSSNSLTASVDFPQPGGSAVSGNDLYVVDVAAWTLTKLDRGLHRGASVPAGKGPTHAVADLRGDVVVADTRGGAVLVFTSDLKQRLRVDLPGRPYGIAYDAIRDRVWVTLTARNEVVSLQGPDYRESGRWSTVQQPNTVAVDEGTGTVVVASRTEGSLQVLDVPTQRAG